MIEMCGRISKEFEGNDLLHKLLDALDREKILIKDNCKNGTRSKKEGGRRCYVLDYSRWLEYMDEVAKDWDEDF